jgi:hypothetical protein
MMAVGATAVTAVVVYEAMSSDAAGHCYIDPAFGLCAESTG